MDLVCFSHHRWRSAAQRPRQWMLHAARRWRVVYVEEPEIGDPSSHLAIEGVAGNIWVITPHLESHVDSHSALAQQRRWLHIAFDTLGVEPEVLWYDTPAALESSRDLTAPVVVYDRADGAPVSMPLPASERELLARADLVFTSSPTLLERRRLSHYATYRVPGGGRAADEAGRTNRRGTGSTSDRRWDRSWMRAEALIQGVLSRSRGTVAPPVLVSEVA